MGMLGSLSSLIYAAATVALLAFVLECCCRRRLKRLRETPVLVCTVNEDRNLYPVGVMTVDEPVGVRVSTYPARGPYPMSSPYSTSGAPHPAPAPFPAGGASSYPHPPPIHQIVDEAPPPTYEQAMASERARTNLVR